MLERNVNRVIAWMIGDRPQPARVVIAAENLIAVLLQELVGIDARRTGLLVDLVHVDVRIVEWEWPRPQETAAFLIDHEHAATFGDRHDNLTLFIAWKRGADPAHVARVRIETRFDQDAFLV